MFAFGHTGITIFVSHKIKPQADLRIVGLCSLLPDVIDKPFSLLMSGMFQNNTRLIGHTGLMALVALIVILPFRNRNEKSIYSFAYIFHFILDKMWIQRNLPILFWPFYGPLLPYSDHPIERWLGALSDPYTMGGELTGLILLSFLFFKYKLNNKRNFLRFVHTGRL